MEFTQTTRGKRKLLHDGYAYIMDRQRDKVIYWRCELKGKCKGRVRTVNEELDGTMTPHEHPPNAGRIHALKTVNTIKQRARDSEETTSTVIQNCLSTYPIDAACALPKKETLARSVRRQRTDHIQDGNVLTDELKSTLRGDDFVLHDSDGLLILTTARNLDLLSMKEHWLCDGTFDSAPLGFQLYTIHVTLSETCTVPLVYAIAREKSQQMYEQIFSTLKEKRPHLNPLSFTIDYERAAINAINRIFPNANVYGCYFHFGQCLWRKIQNLGLQAWYNDPANTNLIKSIQALAFVPVPQVIESFQALLETIDDETDDVLGDFLTYFETTWIGALQRGRRRRPLFSLEMWNVHDRQAEGLPRTTNSLEGWHRSFSQRVSIKHPTICRLVSKIRKEQSEWELTVEQVMAGIIIRQVKKKYQDVNKRINSIIEKYDEYTPVEFLRALSHNL